MGLFMLTCVALLYFPPAVLASPAESQLIIKLLKDYNELTRPVASEESILKIEIGMSLLQIIEVNEKQQIITTNIWLRSRWMDVNLKWNASDYDNITVVRIPVNRIWKPDIHLYNSADEGIFQTMHHLGNLNAYISNDGTVLHVPPMIMKTTCKMDVTWFPFDEQICVIKFGSWTYSGLQLDLEFMKVEELLNLEDYVSNGEWRLLGFTARRDVKMYPCCPEPYITVTFSIHIKRQSMYYFFNLLVPCALIGFLAVLGFTLPPDSGEKLSLGVTVLFSLIVFLNMIAESMPSNSDAIPLLGTYFNCIMFMIASSVVSTVVVNLNLRSAGNPKPMGAATHKLMFNWLPWILRMTSQEDAFDEHTTAYHSDRNDKDGALSFSSTPAMNEPNQKASTLKNKWMFAAVVVDRLCLVVSIIFAIISTVVLIISTLL